MLVACALALAAGRATAAAFLVGAQEPDPPTGEPPAPTRAPAEPAASAGSGIRWTLGPIRYQGGLALDLRQSTASGTTTRTQMLTGEVLLATYVWQPWFMRVNTSLGVLGSKVNSTGADSGTVAAVGVAGTGQVDLRIFPVSRFPIGLSLGVSDSRSSGETLVTQYRMLRFGYNQSYRPVVGNDNYSLSLDYSRAHMSMDDARDSLVSLVAASGHRWDDHLVDLNLNFSRNWQSATGGTSRLASLFGRHSYTPDSPLTVDTLASASDTRFGSGTDGSRLLALGQVLQIASTFSWRPRDEQDWLYHPTAPITLVGSVRLSESKAGSGQGTTRTQSMGATAGITKQFSPVLRSSASFGYARQTSPGGSAFTQTTATASVNYSPSAVLNLGDWRYTPTASVGLSGAATNGDQLSALNLQLGHGLSRIWQPRRGDSVNLAVSQSVGGVQQWPKSEHSYGLSHLLAVTWSAMSAGGANTLAGLSVSDSRTWAPTFGDGVFQMVNVQLSRREQLSRYNSWSANFTAQTTRNTTTGLELDPGTGQRIVQGTGWQRFYTGSITFDANRVFGVPRLNFSALLSGSSQQLEQRRLGNPNAPLESVTESAEARLDYSIGRIETRLAARAAKVDGRKVNSLSARLQRRF